MPLHIKLLGIGCRKSRALKNNLYRALARLPELEVEVEEITNVHDILEYQIAAAPALLINGLPAYQDEVPEVEELYLLLKQYQQKQRPMKKLLVPTDFSDVAANAYRFAQKLASEGDWEIEVLHAYHPSFDYSNPYLDMPAAEFDAVKRELMDHFISEHALEEGGQAVTTVAPKTELRIGFAGEEIVRDSKQAGLIIMGTTGQGNLMEQVFGSVSTYVAQHAHCPVLLVPGSCQCGGFSDIVYASNYQAADEAVLGRVAETIGIKEATIHFVHVTEEENKPYHAEQKGEKRASKAGGKPKVSIQAVEVECSDTQEGILRYAEEAGASIIVVGTVHRNLLERLFHRSLTKSLTFHTTIPLMVLHYDD
ncbi:MAG: universal stress protein [Phaeodactylibacter sp.]|nr:universal stress protein [Phaeodactylibacter sp.]MCB9272798.1 universal stress protein [Lewinellaceae bacterium]